MVAPTPARSATADLPRADVEERREELTDATGRIRRRVRRRIDHEAPPQVWSPEEYVAACAAAWGPEIAALAQEAVADLLAFKAADPTVWDSLVLERDGVRLIARSVRDLDGVVLTAAERRSLAQQVRQRSRITSLGGDAGAGEEDEELPGALAWRIALVALLVGLGVVAIVFA